VLLYEIKEKTMPLHFATEPKNGTLLVSEGLNKLSARKNPLSGLGVNFSALQINQPHAVYDLHADAIANNGGLASASASGFRYLVTGGTASLAAAEVQVDGAGTATLLANLNYGPYVEATARALTQVAALPSVRGGSYEVRLLRFSAIALMALWLKADAGGADIIYPLAPAPTGLEAERPYSAADFVTAILPLAQQRAGRRGPKVP
jgi:hypothetical protein